VGGTGTRITSYAYPGTGGRISDCVTTCHTVSRSWFQ